MISILVAEDHAVVRKGVRRLLEAERDFQVCAEVDDRRDLLIQLAKHNPEVIVLDAQMAPRNSVAALERMRVLHPTIKFVLLSSHADARRIQTAIASGADAYILKSPCADEVVSAVRAVVDGECYFSPAVAREIAELLRHPHKIDSTPLAPLALLSARECEVLRLIAEGLAAKEIAADLEISTKTVEAHRTSLMRKLDIHKATELVRYALRSGLIEP